MISKGLCFPLYWYEKAVQPGLSFDGESADDAEAHGYAKRDGITDVAQANFRKQYRDATITKEAIFYYCYGVLHSPKYREQYASDLKKVRPRIPYAPDFRAFEQAGRALAALHLDYEAVDPWPVVEEAKPKGDLNDLAYYPGRLHHPPHQFRGRSGKDTLGCSAGTAGLSGHASPST